MTIDIYFKLIKNIGIKRFFWSFSSNFGLAWLFLEPASFFIPQKLNFGLKGYLVLFFLSLIIAMFQNLPRRAISCRLSAPDTEIEIKIGDLFCENSHLVIGFNDVFDTELGEIIRGSSIQGQFLRKIYKNNQDRLDREIEDALKEKPENPQLARDKKSGKDLRYPIGTTITLGANEKKFFLVAYGLMKNDLTVESNSEYISKSLDTLWQEVRRKCHGENIAIPIIGSDLARSNLSREQLTKLIITSFILESKTRFISRKLTVMIYPKDLDAVDFYELNDFLKSVCF
jgi:hypothetical protein